MKLLEVDSLSFSYNNRDLVLSDVSLSLDQGESLALLGANGSGKTTFLLHLIGLLRGTGSIRFGGLTVAEPHLTEIRRRAGFLFQDPDDQLFMPTVVEDVSFGPTQAGATPAEARRRAETALEQVGILHQANTAPYHLSAGEKQRAALAGILAMQPDLLILDEPTTHLDPPSRRNLIELLQRLPQAKLIATHDIAFARAMARRAVFFDAGRVFRDGPLEQVLAETGWE